MNFDDAVRLLEIGVALALVLRAIEHLTSERALFTLQAAGAVLLLVGEFRAEAVWSLLALLLWQLWRFQGPYNGGSDKLALLAVTCLAVVHAAPGAFWKELALSYLAAQLALSYVISGWVKLCNPDWRNGQALADVFAFSAYPVSEGLRALAQIRRLMKAASWGVIMLELAFPLAFLSPVALAAALILTASFHLVNAVLFGLNRFFWIWTACYPALIWFQARII